MISAKMTTFGLKKMLTGTNTPAYYTLVLITALKRLTNTLASEH
jgi:hypothetical protein